MLKSKTRLTAALALSVPEASQLVGAHVFDRRFHVHRDDVVQVSGRLRGPLGSPDVPGVPLIASLQPGAAVVDASAADVARRAEG